MVVIGVLFRVATVQVVDFLSGQADCSRQQGLGALAAVAAGTASPAATASATASGIPARRHQAGVTAGCRIGATIVTVVKNAPCEKDKGIYFLWVK